MATTIKRGATVKGKVNLRTKPDQFSASEFPYAIPVGSTIEVKFPADPVLSPSSPSVVLSTANIGEITIIDATTSQIAFIMPPAKSLLLLMSKNAAVDCVITDVSLNVDIFEQVKVFNIEDPANL
jgi:hypothetical protein